MAGRFKTIITILILILVVSYLASKLISEVDFQDKIAVIKIDGQIGVSSKFLGDSGINPDTILNFIKKAKEDSSIKGVLIEINSPGGSVVGSKDIADAVKGIDKPKVAFIRDIGASGAYWVASSADAIVSDPMSVTGSIGVLGSYLEFSGLLEKYGVEYESITAGKYKDLGSPYKDLTSEERAILQNKLNKIYDYFVTEIANNRKLSKEKVLEIANGYIYLGTEAKEIGLVDYLGNKDLAINITKQMANITEAKIIEYKEEKTLLDLLSRISSNAFYNIGKGIGSVVVNNGINIRV